jgi:hypothetical protein
MTAALAAALEALERRALAAETEESAFRREAAARTAVLAQARTDAYRRLNLVRDLAPWALAVEGSEQAPGAVLAALRRELAWDDDSPVRLAILDAFTPVAAALAAAARGEAGGVDLPEAFDAFEAWYGEVQGGSFWTLFDVYVSERPVVDF